MRIAILNGAPNGKDAIMRENELLGEVANGRRILSRLRGKSPRKIISRILRPALSHGASPAGPAEPDPAADSNQPPPVVEAPPELPKKRPIPEQLNDELLRLNEANAEEQGVDSAVHVKDFVYWYCSTHELHTWESGISLYFQDGGRSARQLSDLIRSLGYVEGQAPKLLEFASGYGCLTRHLKKQHSWLDTVSCDIHPEAMEFIAEKLGGKTLLSAHRPEDFCPAQKFDIVFALSFFTHMPKATFGRWLKALFNAVEPSCGHLVFTTHGLEKCRHFSIKPEDIPPDGFWFQSFSEQKDLDEEEYGMSMTTPDFVIGEIYRQLHAPIAVYRHAYWWGDQDLWVVKREK